MLDYSFDNSHKTENIKIICGVDEAGRGPLAGPVVAAACILPNGIVIEGLDDSKKLTEKKREKLFDVICEVALDFSVGLATVEEIEEVDESPLFVSHVKFILMFNLGKVLFLPWHIIRMVI